MKSWMTTTIGALAAVIFLGAKVYNHEPIKVEDIGIAFGLLVGGAVQKDFNAHSTQDEVVKSTQEEKQKALDRSLDR